MIQTRTLAAQCRYGVDHGEGWYQRAQSTVEELADVCGVSSGKMALLLAGYSPRTSVLRSVKNAIHFCKYETRSVGCMRQVHKSTMDGLERGFLNGPKTEAFRRALLGDDDALVLDVWSCRGLRVNQSKAYQKRFFGRIRDRFESVAKQLGLSIAQAQACQWSGVMRAHGRNDLDLLSMPVREVYDAV